MTTLPFIIAHRGYSTVYPENSPAAWRGAIDVGADIIEVDLRLTSDMQIVCIHDGDLARLAGRNDVVAEMTSAELSTIALADRPVAPPLALLLDTVPASQGLLFDIKDERPEALRCILEALMASDRPNLILGLHALGSVRQVRAAGWTGKVLGLLGEQCDEDPFFAQGGDIIRIWESVATKERIGHHLEQGRPVWVTTGEHITGRTVGDFDPTTLRRMAANGVTGFLVNDPQAARAALAQPQ